MNDLRILDDLFENIMTKFTLNYLKDQTYYRLIMKTKVTIIKK